MPARVSAIMLVVVSLFLGACTYGPSFSEAPAPAARDDKAILWVFRAYAEPKWLRATLLIDGKEVVTLLQKGYTWVYVEPGTHRFTYKWESGSGCRSCNSIAR
jgi:hypothetical protein